MAISTDERRFLRSWEEHRKSGKGAYIGTFSFGLTIMLFLCSIALGLFMNLPFIDPKWLIFMGIGSLMGGVILSFVMWQRGQTKFRKIIHRETAENN